MTLSNIIGDSIVVFGLTYIILMSSVVTLLLSGVYESSVLVLVSTTFTTITILELVAIITILFTIIGIMVGFYYLNQEMKIRYRMILIEGFLFYWEFFKRLIHPGDKQKLYF